MIVDITSLQALVKEGYLSCQKHPTHDLLIWNYTPRTQFENHWTPETMMCRGLITTLSGEVVARPFGKFFGIEQHETVIGVIPVEPFEVTEKLDGSLGIVFYFDGDWHIATRGSFVSEQAIEGAKMLAALDTSVLDRECTYLFEIIY